MGILDITEKTRKEAKAHGQYKYVSEMSGVSKEWLCKFAVGAIPNPTVSNVAKLEAFFKRKSSNECS
jgi:hypothetical protein